MKILTVAVVGIKICYYTTDVFCCSSLSSSIVSPWTKWCLEVVDPPSLPYLVVLKLTQTVSCAQHPVIQEVARKYKRSPLVVLIRWGIQHGTSVLAKSSNPEHIRGNLEGCLGWELSPEDYQRICSIKFQLRLVDGIRFIRPEGPFRSALLLVAQATGTLEAWWCNDASSNYVQTSSRSDLDRVWT